MEGDGTAARIEAYFDALGEDEWRRLDLSLRSRVAFEIHRRFLWRFVQGGTRVLEVGAGAGRFTTELARMGCRIVASDVSTVQLDLNRAHVEEAGLAGHVEAWRRLDIRDLGQLADGSFDAVVAYGGPLSYVFDEAGAALDECLRVAGSGPVLASVMSLPGSARAFLRSLPPTIAAVGPETFDTFMRDGDQRLIEAAGAHPCRMFSAANVRALVDGAGAEMLAMSASNWLSMGDPGTLEALTADRRAWDRFLDWEESFCAEQGALDGGTHLLFAARRIVRGPALE